MAQQLVKPSVPVSVTHAFGFYVGGWVLCPLHGWTFDKDAHGYSGSFCWHECQADGCDYRARFSPE